MKTLSPMVFIIVPILMLNLQCTTGNGKSDVIEPSSVIQASGQGTQLSQLSSSHWIQIHKHSKDAHRKLYAALGTRDFNVAIHDARIYLQRHPGDRHALTVLASALAMSGRYQLAEYYAKILANKGYGRPLVYNIKALASLRRSDLSQRDFYKAAGLLQTAFEMNTSEIASGLNLGHLYLEINKPSKALTIFRQVKSRCKSCTIASIGEGSALASLNRYSEARKAFYRVLVSGRNNLEAHYRLALLALNGKKDLKTARYHLDKILSSHLEGRLDIKRRANVLLRRIDAVNYNGENDFI